MTGFNYTAIRIIDYDGWYINNICNLAAENIMLAKSVFLIIAEKLEKHLSLMLIHSVSYKSDSLITDTIETQSVCILYRFPPSHLSLLTFHTLRGINMSSDSNELLSQNEKHFKSA